jgi:alkylated DNA repair protein alkB family protein 8
MPSRKVKKKQVQLNILSNILGKPQSQIISDLPTSWLIILNASYDSLITGPQLMKIFKNYKGFNRVEMFFGARPFSYVCFHSDIEAQVAYDHLDGIKNAIVNKVLLLAYAKDLPEFPKRPLVEPLEIGQIPGLIYLDEFISEDEESVLIRNILAEEQLGRWETLNKRSVQHFGYRFDYPLNDIDRDPIDLDIDHKESFLPKWCEGILEKYHAMFPMQGLPNQLTINKYSPGDGIAFHCDRHSSFLSPILIFSLGSNIVMDFKSESSEPVSCLLKRRSLLIIDGLARYGYEHAIRERKIDLINGLVYERSDRFSLTFRQMRSTSKKCICDFKLLCD